MFGACNYFAVQFENNFQPTTKVTRSYHNKQSNKNERKPLKKSERVPPKIVSFHK